MGRTSASRARSAADGRAADRRSSWITTSSRTRRRTSAYRACCPTAASWSRWRLVFVLGVVGDLLPRPQGRSGSTTSSSGSTTPTWYWVVVAIAFNVAAFAAYVALFRGILGGHGGERGQAAPGRRGLVPDHDGRAGRHADLLGRPARAGSCSPTGRCARRACRGAGRPAGWWRSWCSPTRSTWSRWSSSACCCAPACCRATTRSAARSCPPAIAGAAIVILGLVALIPGDFERRLREYSRGYGRVRGSRRSWPPARPRWPRACAPRIDYMRHPSRGALARGRRGRLLGGATSACCGPASRPSAATCRSPCWCRASSWAWPPT